MTLGDIFEQLTMGELSQISIGGGEQGEINEANYKRIIPHVNLALTALYKRFHLKEGRIRVLLIPERSVYPLVGKHAFATRRSTETDRFILDSVTSPFPDDLLKIERVITQDGTELGLNDESDMHGAFTPTFDVLRLPVHPEGQVITVVYRAKHNPIKMTIGYFDAERVELDLPDTFMEPLLYYIASRVNNPIGMTDEFHAGNSYAAKYEKSCQEIEQRGLQIDTVSQGNSFSRRGWV